MMTAFIPFGIEELENLKKYALDYLNDEEKLFVQTADQKAKDFVDDKSVEFITSENYGGRLSRLWQKYNYLRPFCFALHPCKMMPSEIFQNQAAFIIWTVWRASHLFSGKEKLPGAVLKTANFIANFQTPYSPNIKKRAQKKFEAILGLTCDELFNNPLTSFWPYLEGLREFKWEVKRA